MMIFRRIVMLSAIVMRSQPIWASAKMSFATMSSVSSSEASHKRVLITGASGALGQRIVGKFLREGFEVIGTRSPVSKQGSEVDTASVSSQHFKWQQVDVTCPLSVKKLAKEIGHVDILVHCAGGFRFSKAEDIDDADIEFLLNTNLKSAIYLAREFIPLMKCNNFGRIIFISSRSTLQPGAGVGAYTASKAGLNALTASLAAEVLEHDITVNALLPTIIDSPANRAAMPAADFAAWVLPDQLADIAHTLATPWGNPINGALIPVSGRL